MRLDSAHVTCPSIIVLPDVILTIPLKCRFDNIDGEILRPEQMISILRRVSDKPICSNTNKIEAARRSHDCELSRMSSHFISSILMYAALLDDDEWQPQVAYVSGRLMLTAVASERAAGMSVLVPVVPSVIINYVLSKHGPPLPLPSALVFTEETNFPVHAHDTPLPLCG
ncbi:hypothetical protein HBH56_222120 [Parastagonospora nodorum]|uniref:Uncharacterized protein n=1 Tax=Phaeosphaeria nodorum (strain SN15 / ATCC MYA-4574 / FGSC 10173) TaxID=321614 RepID=A0A7U2I0H2_PHANO|nr:hypothetical protein HBH56_222120 [Parastagonospora nodorum]QRC97214.1 hypothetical protein JI435_410290 [Parastagonospora nodorum SN15]KAH3924017.1 hypothetical protein HBH54_199630 [Parastagonospora nodorum]KAH4134316.1 hypothetical protein HBH45_168320 [Parastagonospora nodorum]KAH4148406.1 hypothetical protein HBH44_210990 [Parastagonospora nodorum]